MNNHTDVAFRIDWERLWAKLIEVLKCGIKVLKLDAEGRRYVMLTPMLNKAVFLRTVSQIKTAIS